MTKVQLLFGIVSVLVVAWAADEICPKCDISVCPSTAACNVTTVDGCDCCHVCVRGLEEKCGGAYGNYGVCQKGLECVLIQDTSVENQFMGLCKVHVSCEAVRCAVTAQTLCPQDSLIQRGPVLPGQCCPQPDVCVCDTCPPVLMCTGRFAERQLVARATAQPAHCCDLYECVDKTGLSDCDAVACPPIIFHCPWDSSYLAGENFTQSCCQIPGKCECDTRRCNKVECPPKYTKKLQSAAEDTPGKCCDMYECIPEAPPKGVCVDPETGLKYQSGEYWRRDVCTPCTCFAGAPQCYNYPCERLTCANPITPENECCPKCPNDGQCGAFKCDLSCDKYASDTRGCPICQCHIPKPCSQLYCSLTCPFGLKIGDDGCVVCKCHVCHDVMKHCSLTCGYGYAKDGRGCTLCKCNTDKEGNTNLPDTRRCYDNGEIHQENETWQPNPCTSCTCSNGRAACSIQDCDHKVCQYPVQLPGECCPSCRDGCLDGSQAARKELETWEEQCKQCTCNNGTKECSTTSCPHLQCTEAVIIPGRCCPICQTVMQNIVREDERDFVVVVAATQDLGTLTERQHTFLKHLSVGNDYTFQLKLLFSSDLDILRVKKEIKRLGSIALVNAIGKSSPDLVLAELVVTKLQDAALERVEPDVVRVMTYSAYLELSQLNGRRMGLSVGGIVGIVVSVMVLVVFLATYIARRYLTISRRRQFKHTAASIGHSADQLIHEVDVNRLTINFTRPSVDTMLSDMSPTYSPVTGHDNLAARYSPNPHQYTP